MQLASMVIIMILPHYLICLNVLFLFRWWVCGSSAWFDLTSFLFFYSFSSSDYVLTMQKIILVLPCFFSFDLINLLLFAIIFFTLIIFSWILFSFHLHTKLGYNYFNCYFLIIFLMDLFFYNSIPIHLISFGFFPKHSI
jgi:hypothetical protein